MQARLIAIDANLLHDLWLKAYKTAIYLSNITLRKSLKWKTPYKVIIRKKLKLAHLHLFKCKAYTLKNDIPKQQKL
jgi:type IV secretory pathway TrbF-like protein